MVDVVGHLGMALIWLAPAWFFIDSRKTAATFVGVGFWFGMLPDVDLVLSNLIGTIRHHGVFHTILAVGIMAAVIGPAVGWVLKKALGGTEWFSDAAADSAASLGFVMVFVAGVAHVFADVLSAPDISQGVEPFWPLYAQTLGIDVVWYNNPWFNWGLFLVGVALNVALYVRATPERPQGVRA